MKLGETNPELRRILLTILVADGSALATGVDGIPPTIQISQNGATLTAAGGTLIHVTGESRLYYYEATAAEALVPGFLLVVITDASIQVAIGWAPVGQIFALGETSPAKLRLPMTIYDTSDPPALATGATVTGPSDLRSSINARAFADDPGSLVEIGLGAYYWQATAAAAAEVGFATVRYESTGFGVCLEWVSIDVAGEETVIAPPAGPAPILAPAALDPRWTALDHAEIALSRLPSQYRERCDGQPRESNTQLAIRAILSPTPELEAALIAVLQGLSVDTARGFMLTNLGKLVGRRTRVADDEIERRYVRAQIAANKSDGTGDDVLRVASLVIGDPAARLVFDNTGVAAYVLRVEDFALAEDVATVLVALAIKATAAGVRGVVQYSSQPPDQLFRFDSGPGFDVGHLATSRDRTL